MTDEEADQFVIPPELLEHLESVRAVWSSLEPMVEARRAVLQAAWDQMQPALEAAQAAGRALEAAQTALGRLPELGKTVEQGLRRAYPPNWDVDGVRLRSIRPIVAEDGIPIVWIPRGRIVTELMAANNRDERLQILSSHEAEIISDCAACLEECSAPELADAVALAKRAVAAYGSGLFEPGQALAVVIAENIITDHVAGGPGRGSYEKAKRVAEFSGSIMLAELRRAAAIAPIVRFYTEWYKSSGQPPPSELSRHVSIHEPNLQQYTRSNAVLAMMLAVSLLREVTHWEAISSGSA